MKTIRTRSTIFILLIIMLVAIPITGAGCQEKEETPPSPTADIALSSTLVPNTDFNVYIYLQQDNPTLVLGDIIGTPFDLTVDSLALWGIATEDTFTFSGGLTLDSSVDAANIHDQISGQDKIWTSLSGHTIYFVQGSGVASDTLKSAISTNDFKYYDDEEALTELSLFPDGGTTKLTAVAITRPSKTLVKLIAKKSRP